MTLDEVEVAYFERIQFGLRNFDLTFVFKNYDRPVVRISAIPVECLEEVKNWLNQMDILYSEGTLNLNWAMVMNQIKQDVEGFVDDGGWAVILFDDEVDQEVEVNQEEVDEDSVFTVEEEDQSE
jgi:nucleosome binding factor SPN SPT16 subunit